LKNGLVEKGINERVLGRRNHLVVGTVPGFFRREDWQSETLIHDPVKIQKLIVERVGSKAAKETNET